MSEDSKYEVENCKQKNINKVETCTENNFVVLGAAIQKKKCAVKRVMPEWLANPEIVSADLDNGYSLKKLSNILDPELIEILNSKDITKLFPMQYTVIKWLHKSNTENTEYPSRDVCVSAPTGSGKTLCYVLPIIQQLRTRIVRRIRCVVVVPVQELAAQIYKVMLDYTSYTNLAVGLISGASSFEEEQFNLFEEVCENTLSKVDILIATPGRLIKHLHETKGFSLDYLKYFVIDEADRTVEWLRHFPKLIWTSTFGNIHLRKGARPQKLLFSATLSQDPETLSQLGLFHPILFTTVTAFNTDTDVNLDIINDDMLGSYPTPQVLTERVVECSAEHKPIALYQLLTMHETILKTLVFINSGDTAHRLSLLMKSLLSERKVIVGELSSQLTPRLRSKMLDKFSKGDVHVLISSDALARGLDIPNCQLVISYDVAKNIKSYIHRAGRTGRAGKPGTAVSIVTPVQLGTFKQMLTSVHKPVPDVELMNLGSTADALNYDSHVSRLKEVLEKEQKKASIRVKAERRKHTLAK